MLVFYDNMVRRDTDLTSFSFIILFMYNDVVQ